MIKPEKLKQGDKVAIISLSRGLLGEPFMAHQKLLIEKRLAYFGLEVVYTPNSLKGMDFISENPNCRADDLKWAFADESINGIICAIGGNDTYKTVPYLLEDDEFIELVRNNPKVFIGFSDSTINHLMFSKIGLSTYYGHSAIVDFGELASEMLPYSKMWFEKLFSDESGIEIESSPVWYLERTSFGESELGRDRITKKEDRGYEVLSGEGTITGELFGGCLQSLSDLLTGDGHSDEKEINTRYGLIPLAEGLKNKILFIETSEEMAEPEKLTHYLLALDNHGAFSAIKGVLIGKPQNEVFYDEYKKLYTDIIGKYNKPVLYNMNFGHAHPRCILPYGASVTVNCDSKTVTLNEQLVKSTGVIKKQKGI